MNGQKTFADRAESMEGPADAVGFRRQQTVSERCQFYAWLKDH